MNMFVKATALAGCIIGSGYAQTYDLPILFIDSKQKCLDFYTFEKIPATIKVLDGKSNNVADSSKGIQYDIGIKVRHHRIPRFNGQRHKREPARPPAF